MIDISVGITINLALTSGNDSTAKAIAARIAIPMSTYVDNLVTNIVRSTNNT